MRHHLVVLHHMRHPDLGFCLHRDSWRPGTLHLICGGTICGIICSIILVFFIICGTQMEQQIASVGVCNICSIISFFCIIYLRPRWTWINASRV